MIWLLDMDMDKDEDDHHMWWDGDDMVLYGYDMEKDEDGHCHYVVDDRDDMYDAHLEVATTEEEFN